MSHRIKPNYLMATIPFNKPYINGQEPEFIADAITRGTFAGDGYYTKCVENELERITGSEKTLLTSSCTHALEMCALLCNIEPGDEVIMSSFNFVSAANAFVLRGASIVFVDIRPDTMNINETLIEAAITSRTRAIVAMHYGGVACEMDTIMQLAQKHNLWVIEDAAHCIGAYYKDRHLGSIGHLGTLSFHASKNIHCGEGGALFINDPKLVDRAEIIREKGTNRRAFFTGKVDKYSWVDLGSSYLMSEVSAAFLHAQLMSLEKVNENRMLCWVNYFETLVAENLGIPIKTNKTQHNAHIFYIKTDSPKVRKALMEYLLQQGISSAFHYVPLHTSTAGQRYGRFHGKEEFTISESEKILRLPLYYDLKKADKILSGLTSFYHLV